MLILVVFVFGYGVTSQALLYPGRQFYLKVWVDILYNPYWQVYGELLDLDAIHGMTARGSLLSLSSQLAVGFSTITQLISSDGRIRKQALNILNQKVKIVTVNISNKILDKFHETIFELNKFN